MIAITAQVINPPAVNARKGGADAVFLVIDGAYTEHLSVTLTFHSKPEALAWLKATLAAVEALP